MQLTEVFWANKIIRAEDSTKNTKAGTIAVNTRQQSKRDSDGIIRPTLPVDVPLMEEVSPQQLNY
jgi:hypothetical protein